MLEWLDWTVFLGIVAGLATANAARDLRELGIVAALTALLFLPVKWIGPAVGFAAVGPDAVSVAVILGSLVLRIWRAREARRNEWVLVGAFSEVLLMLLTAVVHLGTVVTVPASGTGLVFTFLLPGIAQVYWISAMWPATATLSHPLTRMCVVWLCLFGIWLVARRISGGIREPA